MKKTLLKIWQIENHIRMHISVSKLFYKIPVAGRYFSMILDRILLIVYGIDLHSKSIQVERLSIAHPSGVLLGGNGIVSQGRVAIMADVKFVARTPDASDYLERHRQGNVFTLGDNVVVGTGSTIIGPITICDNVMIGAMSLVNKDISEPGVYVGIPAQKISSQVSNSWIQHL